MSTLFPYTALYRSTEADASSVIALLMLDSAQGGQIEVEATGPQENEALQAVIELFNAGFDED